MKGGIGDYERMVKMSDVRREYQQNSHDIMSSFGQSIKHNSIS